MGLLSAIKQLLKFTGTTSTMIGVTEAVCPYCAHQLAKMPGRKKECPSCGNPVFVRTRPQDKARILVRQDQLVALEEQWTIENGTYKQFLAGRRRLQSTTNALRARFGREPSENDVQWAILNDDLLTYMKDMDWGHYRNARFAMAEMLSKELKHREALSLLLEVCYIDLNGPRNCAGERDRALLREFPPFDPKVGEVAPGVIERLVDTIERLGFAPLQVEAQFCETADKIENSLKLPLSARNAWQKMKYALKTA